VGVEVVYIFWVRDGCLIWYIPLTILYTMAQIGIIWTVHSMTLYTTASSEGYLVSYNPLLNKLSEQFTKTAKHKHPDNPASRSKIHSLKRFLDSGSSVS
jgi:hypothetical protein